MTMFDISCLSRCRRLARVAREAGLRLLASHGGTIAGPWEWAGHRDYAPGDDYRAVDWGICARHDELRLRRRSGGGWRRLDVLLDCSRSMGLGSPAKFDVARQAVATIGFLAAVELIDIRVSAFADGLIAEFAGGRGEAAVARLLRFLESLTAERAPTDFLRVAERLHRRCGPILLVSDLFEWPDFQRGIERLLAGGRPVSIVHLYDRSEVKPRLLGDVGLDDVETGVSWDATITERHLVRYVELFRIFLHDVQTWCRSRGIACLQARTDKATDDPFWKRLGADWSKGPGMRRIAD